MNFRKTLTSLLAGLTITASLFAQGASEIPSAVSASSSNADPKYVFMFIGDGMSAP